MTATGGNCCFRTVDFTGSAVIPLLGSVAYTGQLVCLEDPDDWQAL